MISAPVRIATRQSALALWQAHHVADALRRHHPGLVVELLPMTTQGDRILDVSLAKIGGKGLFVKELEQALLEGRADLAVHSMKDVPMAFPDGLGLAVILARENPQDALVSPRYGTIDDLPHGAVVGTSSLRRQAQLRHHRPDLVLRDLRGNVNTRLARLDEGQFDAIILAAAGLIRLDLSDRIRQWIPETVMLPAVGQGAVGVECRLNDTRIRDLLAPLADPSTEARVTAERALNTHLQGGCQVPIAGFAVHQADRLWLRGRVGSVDGQHLLLAEAEGSASEATALGIRVADQLLAQGAGPLLAAVYDAAP